MPARLAMPPMLTSTPPTSSCAAAVAACVVHWPAAEGQRPEPTRPRSLLAAFPPPCTPAARQPLGEVPPPPIISTPACERLVAIGFPPHRLSRLTASVASLAPAA